MSSEPPAPEPRPALRLRDLFVPRWSAPAAVAAWGFALFVASSEAVALCLPDLPLCMPLAIKAAAVAFAALVLVVVVRNWETTEPEEDQRRVSLPIARAMIGGALFVGTAAAVDFAAESADEHRAQRRVADLVASLGPNGSPEPLRPVDLPFPEAERIDVFRERVAFHEGVVSRVEREVWWVNDPRDLSGWRTWREWPPVKRGNETVHVCRAREWLALGGAGGRGRWYLTTTSWEGDATLDEIEAAMFESMP